MVAKVEVARGDGLGCGGPPLHLHHHPKLTRLCSHAPVVALFPARVGQDSTHSNSWRQLRIINSTHDWNYVEYDPAWTFDTELQHVELCRFYKRRRGRRRRRRRRRRSRLNSHHQCSTLPFSPPTSDDIADDPYQVRNIYAKQSDEVKDALTREIAEYWRCGGKACP